MLAGAPFPWAVAGGWALDLARGAVTRRHADVDVAVFREHQQAVRAHLPDWRWTRVVAGRREPWPAAEWLARPVHELHAAPPGPSVGAGLEVLLNERSGADWVFRRDSRIRLPLAQAVRVAADGATPVLAPEVVLLYKAKAPRAVDEADFAATRPDLTAPARRWLAAALALVHPGHAWWLALAEADP
jgi:hypothetical protein